VHQRNWILLFVLALLVAANVAFERPVRTREATGRLLPGLDAARRITIEADGEVLEIRRDTETGGWSLPQRHGFPALTFAVDELLTRLGALSLADRVGEERASWERFGLGGEPARLRLDDGFGSPLADVFLGVPAAGSADGSAGRSAGCYVRPAGSETVYRAARFAVPPTAPPAWLDTRLADFDPGAIRSVVVSHEAGRVQLELRREGAGWRRVGNEGGEGDVPATEVERLVSIASTLYFEDVLSVEPGPAQGFGNPPETVLKLSGGADVELWIGTPSGTGYHYATNAGWPKPWVVSLPSESTELLFAAIDALQDG
ncbi:MAG: DUF4340 domain-containing protein, partial [Planctomycetota bacterium]|nr:DUF4340 domain-containing protein [Planctomycetota bacterium]